VSLKTFLENDADSFRFALKELRLIIATMVRRYELSLVEGQSHELRTYIVPYFKQGFYKIGLKLRD
jgi:cytochrome P450